jgi:hypothetical protein
MDSQTQTNTSTAHLRQAFEMFGMGRNGSNGWVYIGLRNFSSMPCDVWSSQRNSSNQIVLSEVYWLHVGLTITFFNQNDISNICLIIMEFDRNPRQLQIVTSYMLSGLCEF